MDLKPNESLSTKIFTSDGAVYEMVYVIEEVTVMVEDTVTAAATGVGKRHEHAHQWAARR